ncbi:hypothetical protein Psi02_42370 [Planotetraspora silvatica]|uniref:Uncharacterized protein n=1 Tax=Planotetraspora silvatica TaxID=234614 RepID=A0A8J3UMA1_9ACTN|nr:hypothetical protein Psi02_42370 [Planotetraspora silvatica]
MDSDSEDGPGTSSRAEAAARFRDALYDRTLASIPVDLAARVAEASVATQLLVNQVAVRVAVDTQRRVTRRTVRELSVLWVIGVVPAAWSRSLAYFIYVLAGGLAFVIAAYWWSVHELKKRGTVSE